MRLCIATSSYPSRSEPSFAGVFARDFARELVRRGIEVSVFTQDTGDPPPEDDGIEVVSFAWPGRATPLSSLRPYHPLDALKALLLLKRGAKQLARHCIEKKVELVLALWALPAGHWAMGLRRRFGVPFAVWSLGSDIWVYGRHPVFKSWVRTILRQSSYCFADGVSLVEEIRSLSGRPCSFLPTTRRLPREGLPDLSFDPDKVHYLFIGRYHPHKGPDLLLEAIHRIDRETLSALQFHFFGMGPLERDLRKKVLEYGLNDCVTLQGPVDPRKIPVILSDALQFDCSLIVTDVGDMGPLVRSYRAGVVVDPESPERLKEAILGRLRGEKDEFSEGRRKLYALFDLERSVDSFLKTIETGSQSTH
jgi:glycosyltransferase involved in cell wall biosynthesis